MQYRKLRTGNICITIIVLLAIMVTFACSQEESYPNDIRQILDHVRNYNFEPNNTPRGVSHGIGDMDNKAWRVRILAIRE